MQQYSNHHRILHTPSLGHESRQPYHGNDRLCLDWTCYMFQELLETASYPAALYYFAQPAGEFILSDAFFLHKIYPLNIITGISSHCYGKLAKLFYFS